MKSVQTEFAKRPVLSTDNVFVLMSMGFVHSVEVSSSGLDRIEWRYSEVIALLNSCDLQLQVLELECLLETCRPHNLDKLFFLMSKMPPLLLKFYGILYHRLFSANMMESEVVKEARLWMSLTTQQDEHNSLTARARQPVFQNTYLEGEEAAAKRKRNARAIQPKEMVQQGRSNEDGAAVTVQQGRCRKGGAAGPVQQGRCGVAVSGSVDESNRDTNLRKMNTRSTNPGRTKWQHQNHEGLAAATLVEETLGENNNDGSKDKDEVAARRRSLVKEEATNTMTNEHKQCSTVKRKKKKQAAAREEMALQRLCASLLQAIGVVSAIHKAVTQKGYRKGDM
ncbi:hypothetical protein V8G54_009145 [Vigna mungo]|uniref:Uncharacterized protein n=1 Tax=Vigna mungo TaxID=3915 RepID=A0AAQ3NXH1_VIGMU